MRFCEKCVESSSAMAYPLVSQRSRTAERVRLFTCPFWAFHTWSFRDRVINSQEHCISKYIEGTAIQSFSVHLPVNILIIRVVVKPPTKQHIKLLEALITRSGSTRTL